MCATAPVATPVRNVPNMDNAQTLLMCYDSDEEQQMVASFQQAGAGSCPPAKVQQEVAGSCLLASVQQEGAGSCPPASVQAASSCGPASVQPAAAASSCGPASVQAAAAASSCRPASVQQEVTGSSPESPILSELSAPYWSSSDEEPDCIILPDVLPGTAVINTAAGPSEVRGELAVQMQSWKAG